MRRLTLLIGFVLALLAPAAAQAAVGGIVKGTVTPLEWAPEVEVCVVEEGPSATCTAPATDGTYALENVPFFGVKIEFVPSVRSRLLKEYYEGKMSLSQATVVVLTPTTPIHENIDEDLREGGAISGTVTAAMGGGALPEVEVCAVSTSEPPIRACSDSNSLGEYEIHSLSSGSYKVGFWGEGHSSEYEAVQHGAVVVNAGATTSGVDATMAKGGRIDGRITATGSPVTGISACLFLATATRPLRCTNSDEAGNYSFVGLPPASYQVGFSLESAEIGSEGGGDPDGYASQYYDGVATRAQARAISLPPSAAVVGVNASLVVPLALPQPTPVSPVTAPIIPAAPPILEPTPQKKPATCKKGFRRKKVKGKTRCVKGAAKKKPAHKHKRKHARRRDTEEPSGAKEQSSTESADDERSG